MTIEKKYCIYQGTRIDSDGRIHIKELHIPASSVKGITRWGPDNPSISIRTFCDGSHYYPLSDVSMSNYLESLPSSDTTAPDKRSSIPQARERAINE